ncbi:MAG TPA: MotA/TolQ/ExbB proton channel family protein [Vicinamibacterales bacterium]|nr:MotA/TolQ/ExbB proton channel family protein [Vicinamibacterales bacterium]
MIPSPKPSRDLAAIGSVGLIAAVMVLAQVAEGGHVRALLQPTAALVVFGGSAAALLLSFPLAQLRRTATAVGKAFRRIPKQDRALVARFEQYAVRVRRRGPAALEPEITAVDDPFLSRALGLVVDGVDAHEIRRALTTFNRAAEEADEESAVVLETAAGYAPTLGILGAVLGLIRVMENLATPAAVGAGIAVAFVATVYGVGSANLVLLPLASRLRALSRQSAVERELITEGAVVLQKALHPRIVEAHLGGFIRQQPSRTKEGAA